MKEKVEALRFERRWKAMEKCNVPYACLQRGGGKFPSLHACLLPTQVPPPFPFVWHSSQKEQSTDHVRYWCKQRCEEPFTLCKCCVCEVIYLILNILISARFQKKLHSCSATIFSRNYKSSVTTNLDQIVRKKWVAGVCTGQKKYGGVREGVRWTEITRKIKSKKRSSFLMLTNHQLTWKYDPQHTNGRPTARTGSSLWSKWSILFSNILCSFKKYLYVKYAKEGNGAFGPHRIPQILCVMLSEIACSLSPCSLHSCQRQLLKVGLRFRCSLSSRQTWAPWSRSMPRKYEEERNNEKALEIRNDGKN